MASVVVFGDSWCHGDELNPHTRARRCFPALISQALGRECENHAVSGNSIQGMIWDLLQWNDLNSPADLMLVGITSGARTSWWRESKPFWHSVWIEHGGQKNLPGFDAVNEMHRIWRSEVYHWNQDRMIYLTLMNTIAEISRQRGIPVLSFDIYHGFFVPQNITYPFHLADFVANNWLQRQREPLFMPGGHPNELGHQRIANHLISIIESRKLA